MCVGGGGGAPPTDPLVRLLLGDLFNLVKELPDSQLQLIQLLFGSDLSIIHGMLTDGNVKVNSLCVITCTEID